MQIQLISHESLRSSFRILSMFWGSLLVTAAITSFPILAISRGNWTWTCAMASFGLFTGIATTSIMWSYVYILQQYPDGITNRDGAWNKVKKLDRFALLRTERQQPELIHIADLHAVWGNKEITFRAISMAMAVVISVG